MWTRSEPLIFYLTQAVTSDQSAQRCDGEIAKVPWPQSRFVDESFLRAISDKEVEEPARLQDAEELTQSRIGRPPGQVVEQRLGPHRVNARLPETQPPDVHLNQRARIQPECPSSRLEHRH